MSNTILIIGESGSGKSTAIKNLDPSETFILNVIDKPLPFKGGRKQYIKLEGENNGNYYASDDHNTIMRLISYINAKRPDIKNLIIDDWQYTMANAFMRRAMEKGYDRFSEIGKNAWEIVRALIGTREDLTCFVLSHSDTDIRGKSKVKTIGKMLEDKICVEGMFSIVLHAITNDGKYRFLTQHDENHLAKSPAGMFNNLLIDNDLKFVKECINAYLNEDIEV